jgi:hypothetical protein
MKNLIRVVSLLCIIVFSQCSKDTPSTPTSPSVTLSVDGVVKTATFSSSQLRVETTGDKGRTLLVNLLEGSNLILITISNWGYQNPPADGVLVKIYYDPTSPKSTCKSIDGITQLCDSGTVNYVSGQDFYSTIAYDGPAYENTVKITSNDVGAKKISGEFDVKVQFTSAQVKTLKGKFENVPYIK